MNTSKETLVRELYTEKMGREVTLREILLDLYVEKGMTMKEISDTLHVGIGTVSEWMKKESIPAKKMKWSY